MLTNYRTAPNHIHACTYTKSVIFNDAHVYSPRSILAPKLLSLTVYKCVDAKPKRCRLNSASMFGLNLGTA